MNRFPVSRATSSCWRSKRRISIREDTPFSVVFSEFLGSMGWFRLGSPLISLNVKERILNHMVSSSKESFLCSSETSLKKKYPQTIHFIQCVAFTSFKLYFDQWRCHGMIPALVFLAEWSHINPISQVPNSGLIKWGMITYLTSLFATSVRFLITTKYILCILLKMLLKIFISCIFNKIHNIKISNDRKLKNRKMYPNNQTPAILTSLVSILSLLQYRWTKLQLKIFI